MSDQKFHERCINEPQVEYFPKTHCVLSLFVTKIFIVESSNVIYESHVSIFLFKVVFKLVDNLVLFYQLKFDHFRIAINFNPNVA